MTAVPSYDPPKLSRSVSPFLSQRERPVLLVIAILSTIVIIAVLRRIVDYDGYLNDAIVPTVALWGCGSLANFYRVKVVGDLLKMLSCFAVLCLVTPFATAALAPSSSQLADPYLLAADRLILPFDLWPGITALYASHPGLLHLLSHAYTSIGWQPVILIAASCIMREPCAAWRFLTSWGVSLLFCVVVFPLCPAVGAYTHLHIAPSEVPDVLVRSAWQAPIMLQKFRLGELRTLDANALEGIITMPSFHASASVLLGWGFARRRTLAIPFGVLNAVMWVSSVPIGGHYGVDVIAGSLVALLSIHIASWMSPSLP